MMKKIAAVSAALAFGALSQFALAQTPPPTTTTKPATTTAPATTKPAATTTAPKTTKTATPSPCKGLDEKACTGKTECGWVKATVDKNGKARKAYCRLKPTTKKSATPAKTTTPATTTPPATTTTTAPKVTPPPAKKTN